MGKIAIIGYHEVPTQINPERTRWDILEEVITGAVRNAGIDKDDIQGVINVAPQAQPDLISQTAFGLIPEHFGLKGVKDNMICNAGGASTTNCVRMAEQWITSGMAEVVIVPHTTVQSDIPAEDLISFFAKAPMHPEWEFPFGMTFNGAMALITERYMYETNTSEEEMASVTYALRDWGSRDPMSLFFNKPQSMDDILNARKISTPLRAKDCNMLADGGGCLIIASEAYAKKHCAKPVWKLGHGSAFIGATPAVREDVYWRESYKKSTSEALQQANLNVEDIDIHEIYGAYPFSQCAYVEAVGLCDEGEGARYHAAGHTLLGGKTPCTTMGDATGRGHTGSGVSMAFYCQVARQLRGEAGDNQVDGANKVMVVTAGGSGMNALTTIWGAE
ncbi:thiolase family protein [Thalassotalea sp. Y01]|uniref:thiolase family protein n=1 Tax=Thalassotalea sp. Y01 TaxID=2729613 RepID=UPI00145CDAC3|nr:thiolase family protein [Thalassotalea sp. Y01]NMP16864.1 thiolase family protein [Thalassotalea sp. Y01]